VRRGSRPPARRRRTRGRTYDRGDDDADEGDERGRGAGAEEGADGADEVDRRGDGHRQQQLQRDDHVHLADEGPPHLRALHHVGVHAAAARDGARRVARLGVVAALAVLAHGCLPACRWSPAARGGRERGRDGQPVVGPGGSSIIYGWVALGRDV
jgi:hypothetical protein